MSSPRGIDRAILAIDEFRRGLDALRTELVAARREILELSSDEETTSPGTPKAHQSQEMAAVRGVAERVEGILREGQKG